jgi:hypothetical protein
MWQKEQLDIFLVEKPGNMFNLNLRVVDPEFDVSSLAEFEIMPKAPRCVWA